jgi:hypothetical protein
MLTGKTTTIARFENCLMIKGGSVGEFTDVYDTTEDDYDYSDMPSLDDGVDTDECALYIGSAAAFDEAGSAADLVVQIGFPKK